MGENLLTKIKKMPVPILPTTAGVLTLSNVYFAMGFTWIKYIAVAFAAIVIAFYTVKIATNTEQCKNEYKDNVVFCSLYAGFTMVLMILGSFVFEFNQVIGKGIWLFAVAVHAIHILIFIYRNVIRGFKIETFVPSWFVTFNGILTSTVVGVSMNEPLICKAIVIYGIGIFAIVAPFMVYRVITKPLPAPVFHTGAIFMAPSSLCLAGYMNFFEVNKYIAWALYIAVLAALIYIIYNTPKYFAVPFYPGFAGITFPMAIGVVASSKMAAYLMNSGMENIANVVTQIQGIQLFMTTVFIGFVVYNFVKSFLKN